MRRVGFTMLAIAVGCVLGFFIATRTLSVRGAAKPGAGAVAIPGEVGGQDIFGAYEVVKGWPKDISTLPGNEKWTYGAGQGIFAESPNRVYMLFRGELPNIKAPRAVPAFKPVKEFCRPPFSRHPGGRPGSIMPQHQPIQTGKALPLLEKSGASDQWVPAFRRDDEVTSADRPRIPISSRAPSPGRQRSDR